MIGLLKQLPSLEVQIFSGSTPGNVQALLMGEHKGTLIRNPKG
jgi:isopentenyl phosphate kinase